MSGVSSEGISLSFGGGPWSAVLLCVLLVVVGGNCAACNWEQHQQQMGQLRTERTCVRAGGQLIDDNCIRGCPAR